LGASGAALATGACVMPNLPNLTFELPHWLYWSTLLIFPLVALVMHRRQVQSGREPRASPAVGYFLLVTGGFVGLHRFYARSAWGFAYIPLFLGLLYGNSEVRAARDALSAARRELQNAEFEVTYWQSRIEAGIAGAAERVAELQDRAVALQTDLAAAADTFGWWESAVGAIGLAIAAGLLLDAILMPRLLGARRAGVGRSAARRRDAEEAAIEAGERAVVHGEGPPRRRIEFAFTIDALNRTIGELVAYWSVIAVFVYYYEVVARYVFNSPTNWAHESMFLLFGMQYLLAGGFALLNDSHVRVDIVYASLNVRGKAICDLATSVFFFIFAGTLLWTGFVFARDSVRLWEVSFAEWGIQYWPVKITIAVGGALLIAQGVAKLVRDIATVARAGS
jgi:TRAP-type mannitol/chloroaromatic compound transport system permease small subunit